MTLPTIQQIEALHRKYAPSDQAFEDLWQHCSIVREIAVWCVDNGARGVDRDLVIVGSLLHDIGAYNFVKADGTLIMENYLQHGIKGYDILKKEGFDEVLCRFGSHHTGVGITAEEVEKNHLPLPVANYLAETPEERLVMYADKFHSKLPELIFNTVAWYKQFVEQKFGPGKGQIFSDMVAEFGEPPVAELAAKYKMALRDLS